VGLFYSGLSVGLFVRVSSDGVCVCVCVVLRVLCVSVVARMAVGGWRNGVDWLRGWCFRCVPPLLCLLLRRCTMG